MKRWCIVKGEYVDGIMGCNHRECIEAHKSMYKMQLKMKPYQGESPLASTIRVMQGFAKKVEVPSK